MKHKQDEPNTGPDIVDRAFETLRQMPVVGQPPAHVVAKLKTAVQAAARPRFGIGLYERIRHMKAWSKYATAAAAMIALAAGIAVVWAIVGKPSVAWADVKRQLNEAKTIQYTGHVETELMARRMYMEIKTMSKAPSRHRYEINAAKEPKFDERDASIIVADDSTGRGLMLTPKTKQALEMDLKGLQGSQSPQAFVDRLKESLEGKENALGEKTLDGRAAKGFRVTRGDITTEIWVDAKTGIPIRLEKSGLPGLKNMVLDNFKVNEELPDSLFSMEVPPGYEIKKQSFDASKPTEQDLIDGLKWMAEMNEGVSPDEPALTPAFIQKVNARGGEPQSKPSKEEGQKILMRTTRMTLFLADQANEWRYTGKDVKLGDSKMVIARWRPKGGTAYRILYGDLRIEDAALPPATMP